ncbi:MAG: polyketide synthase dehydratase domain-containing protein, partial [Myxococcaceae bacterium]
RVDLHGNSAQGPAPQRVWDDLGAPLVPSDTPLVDAVIEHTPASITVGRLLDIDNDRFLLQHRLYGVPILPGTFGFELMAEVASLLRPELTVLRGMDLHIDVPLKLYRGQPVQIHATARLLKEENGEVTAEVTTRSELRVGNSDLRQTRVHHRGLFVLGAKPAHVPGTGVLPTALPGARGRSIFHLAKDPVHLGPLFCRAEFVYVGEKSVEGIIRAPRQRDIFAKMTRPFFLFDPLLMDGAFQVAANWDGHHHNVVSVPMGAKSLARGRTRRLSESAHVRATTLEVNGRDVLYDVTVLGEDGSLLLHIHRLWLRRLSAGAKEA